MSEDLTDAIVEAAQSPQSASGEAGSVTARSISELIEADKYAKAQAATTGRRRGLIINKLRPPGSI
ncbi:MAG: hypothetical protein E6R04_07920 [Spirochaetes bacterium]|nr:MAG: hypothetical protein E6R04_07920 [Spirochaetota bacterium]